MTSILEETGIIDEATQLAGDMLAVCRDDLLMAVSFANRPMAQLTPRIQTDHAGCMTDGREALFSPSFVLSSFNKNRQLVSRAYLHIILHCLLRHPFPALDVDPLTWSVAADLCVACIMDELDQGPAAAAIAYCDPERDELLASWKDRVSQPTAAAFYALLTREGVGQEELGRMEIVIGMDSHELWFAQPEGTDEQEQPDNSDANQQLAKLWEQVAAQTLIDAQRNQDDAVEPIVDQLHRIRASAMSLDELLSIYAAPQETMIASDDSFDLVYYSYGLRELDGIALVEPLEYREDPSLRDFCIAIDTSGSCSGPLVRAFISKACGVLLNSSSIGATTRIWLVQCDDAVQDRRVITQQDSIEDMLGNLELKGFGGTDFRPVFALMEQMQDQGEVEQWDALIYFTDGEGVFPQEAPEFDTAFVMIDQPADVPSWATCAVTYSDELVPTGTRSLESEE